MRLVLTGATGFVGQHLLAHLSSLGHECRVLIRGDKLRQSVQNLPGVDYYKVDLRNAAELKTALQGTD